jgi:hypothetical protein
MSEGLTLFLNTQLLDPDEALPVKYLGVPQTRTFAGGVAGNTCGRCGERWGRHRWVLYPPTWMDPLDCSIRPRRDAS